MRLVDSSDGDEHVQRTNEMLASRERLGRWVALSEAVLDQLRRSGRDFETSDWLWGPPRSALAALTEWIVDQTTGGKLSPDLAPEVSSEPAAKTPNGQVYVGRVRRAIPIAWGYQVALWADSERELRQDFESLWRELDEWSTGRP